MEEACENSEVQIVPELQTGFKFFDTMTRYAEKVEFGEEYIELSYSLQNMENFKDFHNKKASKPVKDGGFFNEVNQESDKAFFQFLVDESFLS